MRLVPATLRLAKKLHSYVRELFVNAEIESPTFDFETFFSIYGRLMINSFEICGENRQEAKAWGLYLAASVMNHSWCVQFYYVERSKQIHLSRVQSFIVP